MSQYLSFFTRSSQGEYLPLASYSRSTEVYQAMRHAPYGRIRSYSASELANTIIALDDNINSAVTSIKSLQKAIESVERMTGHTVEEKIETVTLLNSDIQEAKEEIEVIKRFKHEIGFLMEMIPEIPIYAGIEISEPTDADRV